MSTEKLNVGDTVYTPSGSEVVLVSVEHDGYVVRPFLGTGNAEMGEDDLGDPELVRKVYAKPPAERLAEDAAKAQAAVDEARGAVNTARQELRDLEATLKARRDALTLQPDLQPLIEFMEGKITHIAVIPSFGPIRIQTIEDALRTDAEGRKKEFRMLALYGACTGPDGCKDCYTERERYFTWKLSASCDGSGSQEPCFLGSSEDSVRAKLQAWFDVQLKNMNFHGFHRLAANAVDLGMNVPPRVAEIVAEAKEKARVAALEQARREVTSAENSLALSRTKLLRLEAEKGA